jgi:hypothetical protein
MGARGRGRSIPAAGDMILQPDGVKKKRLGEN